MNSVKRWVGLSAAGGFLACVVLANYAITHWGTVPFPGGPHTVTIGPWTAPSGVLFVGLSFCLRDTVQMTIGKFYVLAAIIVGAALSYVVAPSLAVASAVAFLVSELADFVAYTPLAERGRLTLAIILSNTIGAAVDTTVFLWLAFHSLNFWSGQFWLKLIVTAPFLLVIVPIRLKRKAIT